MESPVSVSISERQSSSNAIRWPGGSLWMLSLAFLLTAGCSQATVTPSGPEGSCPDRLQDLRDPALADVVGPRMVAGTGHVIRFLDSSDSAYRGYEVSIETRIAGLAHNDPVRLVHTQNEIAGIVPGDEVLVFGVSGPMLLSVTPYSGCPPLVPTAVAAPSL